MMLSRSAEPFRGKFFPFSCHCRFHGLKQIEISQEKNRETQARITDCDVKIQTLNRFMVFRVACGGIGMGRKKMIWNFMRIISMMCICMRIKWIRCRLFSCLPYVGAEKDNFGVGSTGCTCSMMLNRIILLNVLLKFLHLLIRELRVNFGRRLR